MISKPSGRRARDSYALTPMQQGMLLHSVMAPEAGIYIQHFIWQIQEPLDVTPFREAWERLVERHAVLRTSFHWESTDTPWQDVHAQVRLPWSEHDWRGLAPAEREQGLEEFLQTDRRAGFDLSKPPLMRLALIQMAEADWRLVWTHHHALLDGRAYLHVLREVAVLYDAVRAGTEPVLEQRTSFKDYVEWLGQQDFSRFESYWRGCLKGFLAPTPLPEDQVTSRAKGDVTEGIAELRTELSADTCASLEAWAREHGVTLNTVLQGTWAILLHRYSGNLDVVFGATRACRRSSISNADSIVGPLLNTVPMRVRIEPDAVLGDWLQSLRKQWLDLRTVERTPLADVQRWSELPPGIPLFESLVVFESHYLIDAAFAKQYAQPRRWSFRLVQRPNYPLTLAAYGGETLILKIEYDPCRFHESTIHRWLGHLRTALDYVLRHPNGRVDDLEILTAEERRQLMADWNANRRGWDMAVTLPQLITNRAHTQPDAVAVRCEEATLTYAELNHRANRVAHRLQRLGVTPDSLVGLHVERSLDLAVGLLAIWKAGAAYVPIDSTQPPVRALAVLQDAGVNVLVTQSPLSARLGATPLQIINLDTDVTLSSESDADLAIVAIPESLAYVIYTSGSTGQPKGVAIEHRHLANYLHGIVDRADFVAGGHYATVTTFAADLGNTMILPALALGGCWHIVAQDRASDPAALGEYCRRYPIDYLKIVPSHLAVLLQGPDPSAVLPRRLLVLGGEASQINWIQQVRQLAPDCEILNHYGPTETTIGVLTFRVSRPLRDTKSGALPLGRPLSNTQAYILDTRMRPVPIGVVGELYIGGAGVGRGYLGRPDSTAERFVPNPFSDEPGARLYRTGDLARWLAEGSVEFLGRSDFQVKLRGFRVELGEIESTLRTCPGVREALVIAREDAGQDKRLVAYVVSSAREQASGNALRQQLQQRLPDYMLPSAYVFLDRLPLSPNGKVDRRALPAPEADAGGVDGAFVAPATPTEQAIAEAWAQVLRRKRVGAHDNFFALGGHSLLATQVVLRLRERLQVNLPLRSVFDAPTVSRLAEMVETLQWSGDLASRRATAVTDTQETGFL